MKKTIFLVAALSALTAMFVGCSDSTGSTNFADDSINSRYKVGDIVLNDGTAVPYTATLTAEQKSKAIAVIFYVGRGLNSGGDTTTVRVLGVGLNHSLNIAWCRKTSDADFANAFDKDITSIQCPNTGSAGNWTITGDKNGSDNLEQIGTFLTENGSSDDTGTAANYPAFYFAKNYSATATNLGTDYNSGWYLPSIAELYEIYKVIGTVNAAYTACDAPAFKNGEWDRYRSSSQGVTPARGSPLYIKYANAFSFVSGDIIVIAKESKSDYHACAIKEFE